MGVTRERLERFEANRRRLFGWPTGRPVALAKKAVLVVAGRYNPRYRTLFVATARQG